MRIVLLPILVLAAIFSSTHAARGESKVKSPAHIQKATVEVRASVIHLIALYGEQEPSQTASAAAEKFLRIWGNFTDEETVYFSATSEGGTFGLSVLSDPGRWTTTAYPKIEVQRSSVAKPEFDRISVAFRNPKDLESSQERLTRALEALVAAEHAVAKVDSEQKIDPNGTTLHFLFKKVSK